MGIGMIVAALLGPISAVLITLFWERHRRTHEQKQTVLQTLLATRGRYSDPGYSWAIRTIPMHFAKNSKVMKSHADYLDMVRTAPSVENRETVHRESGRRESVLISEILQALGYKGLSAVQIESYTAQGLTYRERLLEDAMLALPEIARNAKRSADYAQAMAIRLAADDEQLPHLPNPDDLANDRQD